MIPIIENPLLEEGEPTPHSADMSVAQFAQFGEREPLTGTWITMDELTPTDDLEQAQVHFFEEYTKAREAGMLYDELLAMIKAAAITLSTKTGKQVSYRSLIGFSFSSFLIMWSGQSEYNPAAA